MAETSPPQELAALRQKITELVAHNAVPMVQQAIDAVREEGQYQAMKYLFEMIGLYPATANADGESPEDDSLARILLERLGLSDVSSAEDSNLEDPNVESSNVTEVSRRRARTRSHPVK